MEHQREEELVRETNAEFKKLAKGGKTRGPANAAEGKQQEAEFRAQRHAQQEKGRAEQQRRKADAKRRKAHDEDEFDGFG